MKPRPDSGHPAWIKLEYLLLYISSLHEAFHAEADATTATLMHIVGKITVLVEDVAT